MLRCGIGTVCLLLAASWVAASSVAAVEGGPHEFWVRVQPVLWLPSLEGDVGYETTSSAFSSERDSENLGLDDLQATLMVEGGIQLPVLFDVHAGLYSFQVEGDKRLERDFSFGDANFVVGDDITSSLEFEDLYAELSWRLLSLEIVKVGVGVGVHLLNVDMRVRDTLALRDERLDETLIIPVLAGRIAVSPIPVLGFEGRLHLLSIDYSGNSVSYFDGAAQAIYRPLDFIGFVAGYRLIAVDADFEDVSEDGDRLAFDVDLAGPYVGLIAQF